MSKGITITKETSELTLNVATIKLIGTDSVSWASTDINRLTAPQIESIKSAIAAYQPGGEGCATDWHCDDPLCFESLSGHGTLRLNTYEFEDFETSVDKINWTRHDNESMDLSFSKIYIRCKRVGSSAHINLHEVNPPFTVKMSGSLASLCEGSAGELSRPYEMQQLFGNNAAIVDAGDLILHTELTNGCYKNMFKTCKALTKAPELPARVLTFQCYHGLFFGCSSLTKSPVLPDATKFGQCYESMFHSCSALNEIEVEATSWNTRYSTSWVYGVSTTGKFTKPSGTSIPIGKDGIPAGWTIINK